VDLIVDQYASIYTVCIRIHTAKPFFVSWLAVDCALSVDTIDSVLCISVVDTFLTGEQFQASIKITTSSACN